MEGKMFRPMAFVFMTALSSALIIAVTVMPVMASLFLARSIKERETFLVPLDQNCIQTNARVRNESS